MLFAFLSFTPPVLNDEFPFISQGSTQQMSPDLSGCSLSLSKAPYLHVRTSGIAVRTVVALCQTLH